MQPRLADTTATGAPRTVPHHRAPTDPSDSATWQARVRGDVVATRLHRADTPLTRMRGLLGRSSLAAGEGMWIDPCPAIHMFFMRFAIDAVFLDADHQVVRVREDLAPWRMARGGRYAHSVLELPRGTAAFFNLRVGDRVELVPPGRGPG